MKMRILVVGNDFQRTVCGETSMSVKDVHKCLRELADNDLLKTFCAAMEVYENEIGISDDIDSAIDNVKDGHFYLTGADTLIEEAELLLVNDDYWGDEEEPDITPLELAEELEFDSTYHLTTLGVLKTN
jgi:hypothetical protein